MSRIRRAGIRWRLLVHEWAGKDASGGPEYGVSHHVTSNPAFGGDSPDGEHSKTHVLPPGTEFDELVVGSFLHIEQLGTGIWWMNIGGLTVHVSADRDGRPRNVSVHMPGRYDEAAEGCVYRLDDEPYEVRPYGTVTQ